MFCFMVKRKLYDLWAGNLTEAGAKKIQSHLEKCPHCAGEYKQMQQILRLVSQKKVRQPSLEFWTKFDQELAERLAQEKVLPQEIGLHAQYLPRMSLKPAFSLATVFVILLALSFYLFGGLPTKGRLEAFSDERLINDIQIIEELTGEFVGFDDENLLLDGFTLLEELG